MTFVGGDEQTAGSLVRTGVGDAKLVTQLFAPIDETGGDSGGAGFNPDDGGRTIDDVAKVRGAIGIKFMEHVADDDGGNGGGAVPGLSGEGWIAGLGALGGVGLGERGMIEDVEVGVGRDELRPVGEHASVGDAAATAPVQDRAGRGRPTATSEFAQHVIPLPTDAFGVSEIVVGEVVFSFPIGTASGGTGDEAFAQTVEDGPVQVVPIEINHGGGG